MSHYTTHPAGPFEHTDAGMRYVRNTYRIPARAAADLLLAATESESGMAWLPLPREHARRKVWATHMTTQNGRFIIEDE
jgi:hypothetical protein